MVSFTPPVMLFILSLIVVFLGLITRANHTATLQSNRVYLSNIVRATATVFEGIETAVATAFERDRELIAYTAGLSSNDYYDITSVTDFLAGIVLNFEPVTAAYYYRNGDPYVYRHDTYFAYDLFTYVDELEGLRRRPGSNRQFRWFFSGFKPEYEATATIEPAIVMVLGHPILQTRKRAFVFISISSAALKNWISVNQEDPFTALRIRDRSDDEVLISANLGPSTIILNRYEDETRGISFATGINPGRGYRFLSIFSWLYIPLSAALSVVALAWLLRLLWSRKRIMEGIVADIERVVPVSVDGGIQDGIHFLQTAVSELVQKATQVEDTEERNREFRIGYVFQKLIEGNRTDADFQEELRRLVPDLEQTRVCVMILEIDNYFHLEECFDESRRALLKLAVRNGLQEMATAAALESWSRWVAENQLAVLVPIPRAMAESTVERAPNQLADSVRRWAERNLPSTVTVAIGDAESAWADAASAFDKARRVLEHKAIIGNNRVISGPDLENHASVFDLYESVRSMCIDLRSGGDEWPNLLVSLVRGVREGNLTKHDIERLVSYTNYELNRQMEYAQASIRNRWLLTWMPELQCIENDFDVLDSVHVRIRTLFEEIATAIRDSSNDDETAAIITRIRDHIAENFVDPGLSLDHYCEMFGLNRSRLSRAFKERSGQKFVDYLIEIRMEHAKKLLTESSLKIEEIAHRVGYVHPFSFSRAFRHYTQMSPSVFRNATVKK